MWLGSIGIWTGPVLSPSQQFGMVTIPTGPSMKPPDPLRSYAKQSYG